MRILLSAYSCGPGIGSEPSTGWNAARELARHHDVWVLTSVLFREQIEDELRQRPVPSLHFEFFDWPHWFRYPDGPRLGLEFEYYCWQVAAYLRGRTLHREIGFDVVHHVTLGRYWTPSFLSRLPVPFIWGPVGGGESAPRPFWSGLGLKGALFELTRECARFVGEHDPSVRLMARQSALAVATTTESAHRMSRLGARATHLLTNVTLTEPELDELGRCGAPPPTPVRFVSIGRLVAWKGFHLGLHAFASMVDSNADYWIVGSGPARTELEELARRLGVGGRVRFLGQLPRAQVRAVLRQCHALVHPSLHDSSGTVLVEAMAAGRPIVCLDIGGPGALVTSDVGFKVLTDSPHATVGRLALAMDRLSASPALRQQLGDAARRRARIEFNARCRGEQFVAMYHEAIEAAPARPFSVPGVAVFDDSSARDTLTTRLSR